LPAVFYFEITRKFKLISCVTFFSDYLRFDIPEAELANICLADGTSVFTGAVLLSTLMVTQIFFTRSYTAIGYPGWIKTFCK